MINFFEKNRTDSLGLWRMICTYMIVAVHCGYSVGWQQAVEFFFIVSGFLMAYEYDYKMTSYKEYMKKRIYRLWPHYIFSFIVYIIAFAFKESYTILQLLTELKHSILEVLMLQILGINDYASTHGAVWYVSSLFVSSAILYAVLCMNCKKGDDKNMHKGKLSTGQNILIIVFAAMGYCSQFIFGSMCMIIYDSKWGYCLIPGLIRGVSEMAVGVECYFLGRWLNNKGIFRKFKQVWIALEVTIMVMVIACTFFKTGQFILAISMYAIVSILGFFVEHNEKFSNITGKLSGYTYSIYLNHPIVLVLCTDLPRWGVLIIITIYSMFTAKIVDKAVNMVSRRSYAERRCRKD